MAKQLSHQQALEIMIELNRDLDYSVEYVNPQIHSMRELRERSNDFLDELDVCFKSIDLDSHKVLSDSEFWDRMEFTEKRLAADGASLDTAIELGNAEWFMNCSIPDGTYEGAPAEEIASHVATLDIIIALRAERHRFSDEELEAIYDAGQ